MCVAGGGLILIQRYFLLLFRKSEEGGRGERERDRERNTLMSERDIDWLPPARGWGSNHQLRYVPLTWNQALDPLVHRLTL